MTDLQSIVDVVSGCNDIPVHPRHPYAGELVFTAFSGSHQDAIKKGFKVQEERHAKGDPTWDIPYLPIDPADLGATYEAIIRVNSQSGKGGIAYLVAQSLGLDLPRKMQVAFYQVIQQVSEKTGKEMVTEDITRAFCETYHVPHLSIGKNEGRLSLKSFSLADDTPDAGAVTAQGEDGAETPRYRRFTGSVALDGKVHQLTGRGNGALSALCDALSLTFNINASIREYSEHAVSQPGVGALGVGKGRGGATRSQAASYIELVDTDDEEQTGHKAKGYWGVGIDTDVTASNIKALLSAASNLILSEKEVVDQAAKAIVEA
jgi:2-isopropylmalate synthase